MSPCIPGSQLVPHMMDYKNHPSAHVDIDPILWSLRCSFLDGWPYYSWLKKLRILLTESHKRHSGNRNSNSKDHIPKYWANIFFDTEHICRPSPR